MTSSQLFLSPDVEIDSQPPVSVMKGSRRLRSPVLRGLRVLFWVVVVVVVVVCKDIDIRCLSTDSRVCNDGTQSRFFVLVYFLQESNRFYSLYVFHLFP